MFNNKLKVMCCETLHLSKSLVTSASIKEMRVSSKSSGVARSVFNGEMVYLAFRYLLFPPS